MENVVYFEQFLAGMLIFRGGDVSHEEIADIIESFHHFMPIKLEAKDSLLYNLVDFVEIYQEGFRLKEGISLGMDIRKGYSLEDHLIINTGKPIYNFMHEKLKVNKGEDEFVKDPFEKVLSKFKQGKRD